MVDLIIEKLILYATLYLDLESEDVVFVRNGLLHALGVIAPYQGEIDIEEIKKLSSPLPIIDELKKIKENLSVDDIGNIMSLISPRPKDVIKKFNEIKEREGADQAVSYLYNLSIHNNYLMSSDGYLNVEWLYEGEINDIMLSINTFKPTELETSSSIYPKCDLCYSNVGLFNSRNDLSKSNLRVIPIKRINEDWFFQLSKYSYYSEHSILVNLEHIPMYITKKTVQNELLFLDQFPNFFIGINSDLKNVGSSHLSHMHYECGKRDLLITHAKPRYILRKKEIPDCEIEYLDWHISCFKLRSKNKSSIFKLSEIIINNFKKHNDDEIGLVGDDNGVRHSSMIILSTKSGDTYTVYLIPRNNYNTKEYPSGIFNTRYENLNIKDEPIGLMESAGFFILPARLKDEMNLMIEILSSTNYSISDIIESNSSLEKHIPFINNLVVKYGRKNSREAASALVKYEIGKISEKILKDNSIFKDTIDGQLALFRFLESIELEVK